MRPVFITTSIAYINAEPHIGFLLELVAADVLARYYRQQGEEVFFLTGTDEHGTKVEQAAIEAKLEPKLYSDKLSKKFESLCKDFAISNDYFIRTTDEGHIKFVSDHWKKLSDAGVLEKRTYKGQYCTGCEAFKTEREIVDGKCVIHEIELDKTEEENYFLKVTDETKEKILSWVENIVPENRRQELRNMLSDFDGVSVSRPKEKLSWGIPVPGDKTQVMYVWVDALLNYLSGLVAAGKTIEDYWPATQIIGKDILKFHAIIWPTILIALQLQLPDKLLVHGFVNVDGKKMSKSLGNVVAPDELKKRYGVEATRYLLLRQLNFYEDSNFVWSELDAIYHGELANGLGNLLNRVVSLLAKCKAKGVTVTLSPVPVSSALKKYDFAGELSEINRLITSADQWISEIQPWLWFKEDKISKDQVENLLRQSSLPEIAQRLEPFMPETAKAIIDQLQSLEPKPLFPRLES